MNDGLRQLPIVIDNIVGYRSLAAYFDVSSIRSMINTLLGDLKYISSTLLQRRRHTNIAGMALVYGTEFCIDHEHLDPCLPR